MRIGSDNPDLPDIVIPVLQAGGVAVMPCDTIYGLVGATPAAEERIRRIKGRGENKPFLRLIPTPAWLPRFTEMTLPDELAPYWPGPLTLIFPAREGGGVALRVPADPSLARLIERLDRPLLSTSVNRAGQPALERIDEIVREFGDEVDLVVEAGDLEGRLPSTVLDLTGRPWRLVRPGATALPDELFSVD